MTEPIPLRPRNGATTQGPDGGTMIFADGRWVERDTPAGRRAVKEAGSETARSLRNLDAEQNVLGSLLFDNATLDDFAGLLEPESFSEPYYQRAFAVASATIRAGRLCDPTVLANALRNDPAFADFGGMPHFADLIDRCAVRSSVEHAGIVADLATRRALVATCEEAMQGVTDPGQDGQTHIALLEAQLADIACKGVADEWTSAGDMIGEAVAAARDQSGRVPYTWGIDELDERTGGLNAGESSIVAGRPGMMKTGVAIHIALANARRGLGTAVFSLEMAAKPMGLRVACAVAHDRREVLYSGQPGPDGNPWFNSATKGRLTPSQWDRLDRAQAEVARLPLAIDTRAGLTVSRIEAAARRLHRKWRRMGVEPGPVIVDHLGIVRPEKQRAGSRHAETADVSRGLAEMAKRLGVPVVALCQLNRGVEGRDDKRPQLSDLRQAGEIEEDARAVVMLYRPAYYLREDESGDDHAASIARRAAQNRLTFLLEKNSHGPTGQIDAWCDPATGAIDNRDIGGAQ